MFGCCFVWIPSSFHANYTLSVSLSFFPHSEFEYQCNELFVTLVLTRIFLPSLCVCVSLSEMMGSTWKCRSFLWLLRTKSLCEVWNWVQWTRTLVSLSNKFSMWSERSDGEKSAHIVFICYRIRSNHCWHSIRFLRQRNQSAIGSSIKCLVTVLLSCFVPYMEPLSHREIMSFRIHWILFRFHSWIASISPIHFHFDIVDSWNSISRGIIFIWIELNWVCSVANTNWLILSGPMYP